MLGLLISLALAAVLAIYYPQTCAPPPPAPPKTVIEQPDEPVTETPPNSNCGSGDEEWSEFEISCNNRLERVI